MTFEEFEGDDKTIDAVLRNLEILGEASKLVPDYVREQEPAIPWSEMAGMRDKLIHGYATVDLEIVWHTVAEEIPRLRPKLESLASDLEDRTIVDDRVRYSTRTCWTRDRAHVRERPRGRRGDPLCDGKRDRSLIAHRRNHPPGAPTHRA